MKIGYEKYYYDKQKDRKPYQKYKLTVDKSNLTSNYIRKSFIRKV